MVLHLRRSVLNLAARAFYASLGVGLDNLPCGEMEVAFASLAADDVLARAERRALKRRARMAVPMQMQLAQRSRFVSEKEV